MTPGPGRALPAPPFIRELATRAPVVGEIRPRSPSDIDTRITNRRPVLVADAFSTPLGSAAAASLMGTSHEVVGSTRQDAFSLTADVQGRVVVAIADGLGSRAASHVGATTFCEQVTALVAGPTRLSATSLLNDAAHRTEVLIDQHYGLSPREAGFVALVLIADDEEVQVARVGDASCFVIGPDAHFAEVFPAPDGALNDVSAAFPWASSTDVESLVLRPSDNALAVATDGIALDIRMSPGIRSWLADCWSAPLGPFAMADSLRYARRGSLDDRTAAVVWPLGPSTPRGPLIDDHLAAAGAASTARPAETDVLRQPDIAAPPVPGSDPGETVTDEEETPHAT